MIQLHIYKYGNVDPASLEAAVAALYSAPKEADTVVVRFGTDAEFIGFMAVVNEKTQGALRNSQLIGGVTYAWVAQSGMVFVDGTGWRVILNKAAVSAQQPMPQPNGMRRQ